MQSNDLENCWPVTIPVESPEVEDLDVAKLFRDLTEQGQGFVNQKPIELEEVPDAKKEQHLKRRKGLRRRSLVIQELGGQLLENDPNSNQKLMEKTIKEQNDQISDLEQQLLLYEGLIEDMQASKNRLLTEVSSLEAINRLALEEPERKDALRGMMGSRMRRGRVDDNEEDEEADTPIARWASMAFCLMRRQRTRAITQGILGLTRQPRWNSQHDDDERTAMQGRVVDLEKELKDMTSKQASTTKQIQALKMSSSLDQNDFDTMSRLLSWLIQTLASLDIESAVMWSEKELRLLKTCWNVLCSRKYIFGEKNKNIDAICEEFRKRTAIYTQMSPGSSFQAETNDADLVAHRTSSLHSDMDIEVPPSPLRAAHSNSKEETQPRLSARRAETPDRKSGRFSSLKAAMMSDKATLDLNTSSRLSPLLGKNAVMKTSRSSSLPVLSQTDSGTKKPKMKVYASQIESGSGKEAGFQIAQLGLHSRAYAAARGKETRRMVETHVSKRWIMPNHIGSVDEEPVKKPFDRMVLS